MQQLDLSQRQLAELRLELLGWSGEHWHCLSVAMRFSSEAPEASGERPSDFRCEEAARGGLQLEPGRSVEVHPVHCACSGIFPATAAGRVLT